MLKIYLFAGLVACVVGTCTPPLWQTNISKDTTIDGRWYIFAEKVVISLQADSLRCATATNTRSTFDSTQLNTYYDFIDPKGHMVSINMPGNETFLGSGLLDYHFRNKVGNNELLRVSIACGSTGGNDRILAVTDCNEMTGEKGIWIAFNRRVTQAEPLTSLEQVMLRECLQRNNIDLNSLNTVDNENCPNI